MKTSLFLLSATLLLSNISKADNYQSSTAACGYSVSMECVVAAGYSTDTFVYYFAAGSPRYQGSCLSEAQVTEAISNFNQSADTNKKICANGKSIQVHLLKTFESGSSTVASAADFNSQVVAGRTCANVPYRYCGVKNVEKSLFAYLGLKEASPEPPKPQDNPKVIRASTKNSGASSNNNSSVTTSANGAVIRGAWQGNKPVGDVLVSYPNGSIYVGEYSARKTRTGQGILISTDGTKKNGLWFDDIFVGTRASSDKLPNLKDLQKVFAKLMPNNDELATPCDSVQGYFAACKYSASNNDHTLKEFGANLVANHLNVNLTYTDYDNRPSRVKSQISSLLTYLVQSGRFSVYAKSAGNEEALELLKIVLGRYKLYDSETAGCGDDSCIDDENFEIKLVETAAGQCSETLIDNLEMKGFKLISEIEDADPAKAAKEKAEEFPAGSLEYNSCMRLAKRLTKP